MTVMDNDERLAQEILKNAGQSKRFIVALAGPPAAGKSTLSAGVCARINALAGEGTAVVVPMDGYHLDNRLLEKRGLLRRKGAPQTFDAEGFTALVKRLRDGGGDVIYPLFDRERDIAIAGAAVVAAATPIIILEGNYLLCRQAPWSDLRPLIDMTVLVSAPMEELEKRLIGRWLEHGLDEGAARERALSNDIPNAKFVLDTSDNADVVIQSGEALK